MKRILQAVVAYFREHPGTATTVGGLLILALARFGVHVTMEQLTALAVILVPLISGVHVASHKARTKRIHNAYRAQLAGRAEPSK